MSAAERDLKSILWALPPIPRGSPVTKVHGRSLCARALSPEAAREVAAALFATRGSLQSDFEFSIVAAPNEPFGIYLDIDAYVTREHPIISLSVAREELGPMLLTVTTEFLSRYVQCLADSHLDACRTEEDKAKMDRFRFAALYCPRPRIDEGGRESDMYRYKFGSHTYVGAIQARQYDHKMAFDRTVKYFASREADFTEAVRILRHHFGYSRSGVTKIFDSGPVDSRQSLLPGCRKRGGACTYIPSHTLHFEIRVERGTAHVFSMGERKYIFTPYDSFFFVHPSRPTFQFRSSSALDPVTFESPSPIPTEEETEALFNEAKERNQSVHTLLSLLNLLPFHQFDGTNGHFPRLKLINAVVYEVRCRDIDERKEWAKRVLLWFFNREPISNASNYNTESHVEERIDEALQVGKKCGIGWLKAQARLVSPDAVARIEKMARSRSVTDLLRSLFSDYLRLQSKRGNIINHQAGAALLHQILGEDYRVIVGKKPCERSWFRYNDTNEARYYCKKWQNVGDIKIILMQEVAERVNPILTTIIRESQQSTTTAIMTGSGGISFDQFVREIRDLLGSTTFINGIVDQFTSRCVNASVDFADRLDMDEDIAGCLNGILRFHRDPFRIELLDGDNRALLVSRSLNACWRPDMGMGHPAVRRVLALFREIIPDQAQFDFMMTIAAGVLLTGRCGGEKFYLLFGSGGDGKTTLLNGFTSLGGLDSESGYRGYATTVQPAAFQNAKRDANAHDAGIISLYGGTRLAESAEPSAWNRYLDGGAIKQLYKGGKTAVRRLHECNRNLDCRCTIFFQLNGPLELIGFTMGEQRRIVCLQFTQKFYDPKDEERYRGLKNYHRGDVTLKEFFSKGDNCQEHREALLYILATQYLPVFYGKYNANINAIPLPAIHENATANFLGRHSSIILKFLETALEREDKAMMPMSEFMQLFTSWYCKHQRGSARDIYRKRGNAGPSQQQGLVPSQENPWVTEVLNMVSSSPLGASVCMQTGDDGESDFIPIGSSEMLIVNPFNLFIRGWRAKKRATPPPSTASPSAASPSAAAAAASPSAAAAAAAASPSAPPSTASPSAPPSTASPSAPPSTASPSGGDGGK